MAVVLISLGCLQAPGPAAPEQDAQTFEWEGDVAHVIAMWLGWFQLEFVGVVIDLHMEHGLSHLSILLRMTYTNVRSRIFNFSFCSRVVWHKLQVSGSGSWHEPSARRSLRPGGGETCCL